MEKKEVLFKDHGSKILVSFYSIDDWTGRSFIQFVRVSSGTELGKHIAIMTLHDRIRFS
jgi:hypothetical protein